MRVTYVKYKCAECGALDTDKLFDGESPAPVINCHNCHSGYKREQSDMILNRKGMFIVK